MSQSALPSSAAQWLRRRLGRFTQVAPWPDPRNRHRVFRVAARAGRFVLKLHRDAQSWNAEAFAYRHWCGAAVGRFPKLVDVLEPPAGHGVLLEELPGRPLEGLELPEPAICAAWREAGSLAARVQRQACGAWFGVPDCRGRPLGFSTADPVQYVRVQARLWTEAARQRSVLESHEEDLASWAAAQADCFADEVPRPVNRDFTPGNWLVDAAGGFLGAVDLEEMRWGTRAEGLAHLWTKFAWDRPARAEAFLHGYGDPLPVRQPLQLHVALTTLGLATLVRGRERQSLVHLRRGHDILRRIAETATGQPHAEAPP